MPSLSPRHSENGAIILGTPQGLHKIEHYKLSKSGYIPDEKWGAPLAHWNFETAVAGTYDDDYNGYTMTVNGAPTRVNDYTHPINLSNQGYAWSFDGAADYLSRADDGSFDMDLTNNPTGDFSVQCVVTPHDVSATGYIITKWDLAANRSWALLHQTSNVSFFMSDDGSALGAAQTSITSVGTLANHRPSFITATYHWVADGTSEMQLYVDNNAVVQTNIANGPVFDSTSNLEIAARHGGATLLDGLIHDCKIWKGVVLTKSQHDHDFAEWQGRMNKSKSSYISVSSAQPPATIAAPPDSGVEPFIIDNPANSMAIGAPVSGSGGLYGASALDSKWWRGSVETCAAGHPTGWVVAENQGAGAGTVVVDCDTTTSAHGGTSVLFTSNGGGGPKYARIFGACQTQWIAQDVSFSLYGIDTAGTPSCRIKVEEHSDLVCGTPIGFPGVWGWGNFGATWAKVGGTLAAATWNGATQSWRSYVECQDTGTAYTANLDAAMALQAASTFDTDALYTTDADSDASSNTTIFSLPSPLSPNNPTGIAMTGRSPWAGTDLGGNITLFTDGAGVNNIYTMYMSAGFDEPAFLVTDNIGGQRAIDPNVLNWAKDTDYNLMAGHDANGNLRLYWNAGWQTTMAGAGTGIRSAGQDTTYISGSNTAGSDVWSKDLRFYELPENQRHLVDKDRMVIYSE